MDENFSRGGAKAGMCRGDDCQMQMMWQDNSLWSSVMLRLQTMEENRRFLIGEMEACLKIHLSLPIPCFSNAALTRFVNKLPAAFAPVHYPKGIQPNTFLYRSDVQSCSNFNQQLYLYGLHVLQYAAIFFADSSEISSCRRQNLVLDLAVFFLHSLLTYT